MQGFLEALALGAHHDVDYPTIMLQVPDFTNPEPLDHISEGCLIRVKVEAWNDAVTAYTPGKLT